MACKRRTSAECSDRPVSNSGNGLVVDELTRRSALYTRRRRKRRRRAEEGLLLLRDAWLEIEGLLTTEQRAKWQQMAAQRRQT